MRAEWPGKKNEKGNKPDAPLDRRVQLEFRQTNDLGEFFHLRRFGVALAPANFGTFSNALLVGNFGNGADNAAIYTNEANFDLRETVNEPRVFGGRLLYRFGKQLGNSP